ncbi:NAD(P)/FAD-dependent oxidoreductase [Brachyspira intermedia]|uniref:NAD(P)/FAD-dependent oxidoreductase n=1 Tax=Brachyspira intermedia TaxID=84377 RepID=UPI0030047637
MKYLILGASASGLNGARELRMLDKNADITLVSIDDKIYSRCMLHYYISGKRNEESLNFMPKNFFSDYNIKWINNTKAVSLDADKKTVKLSNGNEENYDKLLLATGASGAIPPIENLREANNVVGVRTLDDCNKIMELAKKYKKAAVIGAGLIGVDVVSGILPYNLDEISIIDIAPFIISKQLDEHTANVYQNKLKEKNVDQYYSVKVKRIDIDNDKNPRFIELEDGKKIEADFIVVAMGISPNIDYLKNTAIKLNDAGGVEIDKYGRTNIADIYAAGDITVTTAIWSAAVKQAIIAANNMVGNSIDIDNLFNFKSTMNLFNIPSMSIGTVIAPDDSYSVEIFDDKKGNYRKIVHKDGKIIGALLQGDLRYSGILTQLIKENIDVTKVKKPLFKIDYSDFFNIDENFKFAF